MSTLNPGIVEALRGLRGSPGSPITNIWFFQYALTLLNIAQGGTATGTIRINAGTDFFCQGINFEAVYQAATTPTNLAPNAKLIRESEQDAAVGSASHAHLGNIDLQWQISNRPFMNQAISADLCTGEPGTPFLLPTGFYCPGNDSLLIQMTNNLPALTGAAAPAIDCRIVFVGVNMQVDSR